MVSVANLTRKDAEEFFSVAYQATGLDLDEKPIHLPKPMRHSTIRVTVV
ncbi:hypothetical protein [Rhizobium mesosinicum]